MAAFVLCTISPIQAEEVPPEKIAVKPGAPPGFEGFDAPYETMVDVNYGGLKIGSFRAIFTQKSLLFSQPERIVDKITDIKHEELPRVIKALSGELPTHADAICGNVPEKGCGTLLPEVAAVIFYEEKFRADLFLSPTVLSEQDTHKDKILPLPPDVFSAVHSFNGGVTGATGAKQNYSLLTNSTYAYGPGRVNMIGIASADRKQINTATASVDRWGLDNRAGYFDSTSSQLLPQIPMIGVSSGTSLNTNLALRDAAGSRLSIFLPQRSFVSIIHNNVIFSTEFYEAGNQVLNTDNLPEGTYEITIRIRDTFGVQTEERRFFAKNFLIPPEEQPIYRAQIGAIRDLDVDRFKLSGGQGVIGNVGTVQRIDESMGGNASLAVVKDQVFTEAGAFLLLPPDQQVRVTGLLSSSQDMGFGLSYLGYGYDRKLAVSGDSRVIFSGKKDAVVDDIDPIKTSSKQLSGTASYQLSDLATVLLQGNYNITGGTQGAKYSYGPQLRYDFWRSGESNLSITTDSSQTETGNISNVFLRYSIRIGSWAYLADTASQRTKDSNLNSGIGRVVWNDDSTPGRLTIASAELSRNNTTQNRTLDLDHRSDYGNVQLIGTQSDNLDTNRRSNFYSGNFGFSLVHAEDNLYWGGNQQQSSGVIVRNSGSAEDVKMKILVNNTEQSTFTTGGETTVFVTPYQTYNVSIKPAESSAIDYDGSVKNVTLYPGNILPMVWVINRINVVLGHVVMPDGTPLSGARIEEARNISISEEDGLFQAELLELNSITFKRDAEVEKAPEQQEFDIFSMLPTMRPRKSAVSKMSPEEQTRVMEELFGPDSLLPAQSSPVPEGAANVVASPETAATSPAEIAATSPAAVVEATASAPAVVSEAAASAPADKTVHLFRSDEVINYKEKPAEVAVKKLRPAVRCRVTLPESQQLNGVYIYSEPLVCHPISLEEVKAKPEEEKQAHWTPYNSPLRVSKLLLPIFETNKEFAMAVLNIRPKPVILQQPESEEPATPETAYAQARQVKKPEPLIAENKRVLAVPASIAKAPVKYSQALVQLGAYRSESEASEAWAAISNKVSEVKRRKPVIAKVDLGQKGTYYRLRVANFINVNEAKGFCASLVAKGMSCNVAKNEADFANKMQAQGEIELPLPMMMAESVESSPESPLPPVHESTEHFLAPKTSPQAHVPTPAAYEAKSPTSPVSVQLGAFRTEAEAKSAMQFMINKFEELQRNKPVIMKVNLGSKGIYYRLRIHEFDSPNSAKAFCRGLSSKGQACIVPTEDANASEDDKFKEKVEELSLPAGHMGGPYMPTNQ